MDNKTDTCRMLDERQTALYIGMSRSFLRKARCEGLVGNRTPGPPFHRVGRKILYDIVELDAWLAKHRVGTSLIASNQVPEPSNADG